MRDTYKPRKRPEIAIRCGNKRRPTIAGQFAPRLIAMLESPAYRVLNRTEHLAMARLEIELANHGGKDNGKLPLTKSQFAEYGVHPRFVAASLRTLEALGFVICTERGRRAYADIPGTPSKFRITYRHTNLTNPTDEWKQIDTLDQAKALATAARATVSEEHSARAKRAYKAHRKNQAHKGGPQAGAQGGPTSQAFPGAQSGPTGSGAESGPSSISRDEGVQRSRGKEPATELLDEEAA
jgi:hypothetical protein